MATTTTTTTTTTGGQAMTSISGAGAGAGGNANRNTAANTNAPQRTSSQIPSAPIPIPSASAGPAQSQAQAQGGQRPANNNNTNNTTNNNNANRIISDNDLAAGPSSLVVPPPPPLAPTRLSSNASFGRKEKKVPKRQKAPYSERVVKSMLYSGVPTAHDGIVNVIAPVAAPKVQVQLLYPGQADNVSVSGTYETSWDIRTDLQYDEAKRMWSTQVQVSPAAYHIKFLVDGVWKTSDALPLATDSGGRLVNYIDVRTKGPEIKEWGKDWWGVGTEDEEDQEQGAWTIKPPAYLEKAAALEEQEENIRRNHSQSPQGGHHRRRILPTPPQLPRHLDKVILNARAPSSSTMPGGGTREGRSGSMSGGVSPGGSGERGRAAHPNQAGWPTPMTGLSPGGTTLPGGANSTSPGRNGRRDSGGSNDRQSGSGLRKSRRGSSSMDVGVYGGLIVSEGGGMTGFGAGVGSPIGDDNSVLPLPSHSVVNHLATSAIRNGVLAVATTTRYKAKYISTVYYRPTHPEDSPEESGTDTDEKTAVNSPSPPHGAKQNGVTA